MKVILREQVPHLGDPGTIVNVKPGFARNFLFPQGLAAAATSRNIGMIEHKMREIQRQIDVAKAEAEQVKARLAELSVTVAKPVGENDKLFGSVTAKDVEKALASEGVTVDRRRIAIAEPIKALGVYTVGVKLHGGVMADLKVWVVKE
ncbi:MAG: 50S ribosomal protein L9 [Proteobacteria bacterium]|jgi:large subunit ribosomal protein L9|nr:50S ribosomal protein L9 [Pseudomonadota bacterium]